MGSVDPFKICALRVGTSSVPLQEADPRAPVDNRQPGVDLWHRQPRLACRSFQSSFSSRTGVSFVLQHPLVLSVRFPRETRIGSQMLSLYLRRVSRARDINKMGNYPIKSIVLMINPRVGLTVVTSSFIIRLTMVVLPALSRPLQSLASRSERLVRVHTASIYAFLCPLSGLFEVWTTWLQKYPAWCFVRESWKGKKCCKAQDGWIGRYYIPIFPVNSTLLYIQIYLSGCQAGVFSPIY